LNSFFLHNFIYINGEIMKSTIATHLKAFFSPVAIIWSDSKPEDAVQLKKDRHGCLITMFAQAAKHGKVAAMDRETTFCPGGKVGIGFGNGYPTSEADINMFTAFFSKGVESARDKIAYQQIMEKAPKFHREKLLTGERFQSTPEKAERWMTQEVPKYDVPAQYVLYKPLDQVEEGENIRAVVYTVNPVQLAGLITLAGSIIEGTDPVQVSTQGGACGDIGCYVYDQEASEKPRAVLGMTGVESREKMRRLFQDDCFTLSLPFSLYQKLEQEAENSIFNTPTWEGLIEGMQN
jgi:uncharacterized protein (DUF169 family)